MKRIGVLSVALVGAALSGCALHPMNYQSGDHMAKAKGLLVHNSSSATDDGLVLYSDNPKQSSVFGPKTRHEAKAGQAAESKASPPPAASHGKPGQSAASKPEYTQFQQFEQFQRFNNMPKNSPEYRRFQQWLEWKHYQDWKSQQSKQQ